MAKFAQIDRGVVTATIDRCPDAVPEGRVFVAAPDRVTEGELYDAAARTFTPPPAPIAAGPSDMERVLADLLAIKRKLGMVP